MLGRRPSVVSCLASCRAHSRLQADAMGASELQPPSLRRVLHRQPLLALFLLLPLLLLPWLRVPPRPSSCRRQPRSSGSSVGKLLPQARVLPLQRRLQPLLQLALWALERLLA